MFKTLTGEILTIEQLPQDGVVIIHPETEARVPRDQVDPAGYYYLLLNETGLVDWVDPRQLDWYVVCRMPEAIHAIEAHPERIMWDALCHNPAAMHLLEANPDKIKPYHISANPAAIPFLKANPEKIDRERLCHNPSPDVADILSTYTLSDWEWAIVSECCSNIDYLRANIDKVVSHKLGMNRHALPLFREFPNMFSVGFASENPGLVDLLLEQKEHVNLYLLSRNPSPEIEEILLARIPDVMVMVTDKRYCDIMWEGVSEYHVRIARRYQEHIVWSALCRNPEAIDLIEEKFAEEITEGKYFPELKQLAENPAALHILEKYADVLDYRALSRNKGIYK